MIADVAFDAPVRHSFSYRIPDGWALVPGQRARAPLRGAARVGMVVAVRDGADTELKPLARLVDTEPVLSKAQLDLVGWIAAQSLSSVGSTCAALLPPPVITDVGGSAARGHAAAGRPASPKPELLIGAGREKRVLERLETGETALVLAADVETAARWAQRLAKIDRVVRLDSGVPDEERAAAWGALRDGSARLAAGTRSALLAPLPSSATLVLIDEYEAAHKPPGAPRMHSRDVALERAAREPLALLLTAATPSAEAWWRAESGLVRFRLMTSTLASFQRRAPSAIHGSHASAARTPGTLFAAIDAPVPVQQKHTPVAHSPLATSAPTCRPISAHCSSPPPGGPTSTSSCPRASRSAATASVSAVRSSDPNAIRMISRLEKNRYGVGTSASRTSRNVEYGTKSTPLRAHQAASVLLANTMSASSAAL